jgi:hypothetical protein
MLDGKNKTSLVRMTNSPFRHLFMGSTWAINRTKPPTVSRGSQPALSKLKGKNCLRRNQPDCKTASHRMGFKNDIPSRGKQSDQPLGSAVNYKNVKIPSGTTDAKAF